MTDQWQDPSIYSGQIRDDDEDIPDEWDAEPEEKPQPIEEEKPKQPVKAPPTTKNKASKKKFGDDDFDNDEEFLKSLKEPNRVYTEEELEELRKQGEMKKEKAILEMNEDFLGVSETQKSLYDMNLVKREDFTDYSFRLCKRLTLFSKSEHYYEFLDHLLNGLTKEMNVDNVKKISAKLTTIMNEKQIEDREKKNKLKVKKTFKAQPTNSTKSEYETFFGESVAAPEKPSNTNIDDFDFM